MTRRWKSCFRHNPKARIIWAHIGFSTPPEKVEAYLDRYPALWGELSHRHGIAGAGGELSPAWRRLFERYPDRFPIGSDTWINEHWFSCRPSWPDTETWLSQLPREVAERLRFATPSACSGSNELPDACLAGRRCAG